MNSTLYLLGLLILSQSHQQSRPAQVSVGGDATDYYISWHGDENLLVAMPKTGGVFWSPLTIVIGKRSIVIDGFYAAFNGKSSGFKSRMVNMRIDRSRLLIDHVLSHPELPAPIPVRVVMWMTSSDKAVRVQFSYPEGKNHLDRLGILSHRGPGIEAKRMFLGRMLVMDGPFRPFDVKHNYNMTRYWCFSMANGITEMQGTDRAPRGFSCDPADGRYDLHTYCDSPITYTFVFTGKGPQEAIAQYRNTLNIPAPPTLKQLPGRVVVMAAYPIKERYEDFLDELTGRGVRDFIWLSYSPSPDDRKLVEPYGALYAVYDMYTDLFDKPPRGAKGWSPKLVLYDSPGHMKRGYWNATRLLPDLYVQMARTRVQGTLGREMENHGFQGTQATRYSNLTVTKKEVRPTALYLDVHSSKTPFHYWDYLGHHHPAREYMKHEAELFDFARKFLGNVPILSEGNGEAYAGLMDGGIFMDWPTPDKLGITCGDWEYYPNIDQVHRERLLPVGFHWPLMNCDPEEMSLSKLFGRLHSINAYSSTPQTDPGRRGQVYYATSAFHRMLGLSRLDRVDLDGDNTHRLLTTYSNGAKVWSNRGQTDWDVQGFRLPPLGFLALGPNGFKQFRARTVDGIVESLTSGEYRYFASEKLHDFGPVIVNGAVAVRSLSLNRLAVYELIKPQGLIQIRLGRALGTHTGQRAIRAWFLLTRGRRVPFRFPDLRQNGDIVQFSPPEMTSLVGYEIEFAKTGHGKMN